MSGRARRTVFVLFANTAGNGCCRTDGNAHCDGVYQEHHRLRDSDNRNGVGTKRRDKENVDDCEDALHDHFEDHRNRKEENRQPFGTFREVPVRSSDCLLKNRPE